MPKAKCKRTHAIKAPSKTPRKIRKKKKRKAFPLLWKLCHLFHKFSAEIVFSEGDWICVEWE